MNWYWLSFATADESLGVAIVPGYTPEDAVRAAHVAGCNPGGQVLGFELPADAVPAADYCMRLLTKEEVVEAGYAVTSYSDMEAARN